MVSQLKIDLCDNKGAKKQCSCSICSSSLLQQLSQLGVAQTNCKGNKDKFFSMLEQRAQKLKSNDSKSSSTEPPVKQTSSKHQTQGCNFFILDLSVDLSLIFQTKPTHQSRL